MTISPELLAAYRYHHARMPRVSAHVFARPVDWLAAARADIFQGLKRYCDGAIYPPVTRQQDGLAFVQPERVGLRLVGRVQSDCGGRNGVWNSREKSGWFTDPMGDHSGDGSGLCYGVVYQLPGHKGIARYVAGYVMGGDDNGATLDLRTVYCEAPSENRSSLNELHDAARSAAFVADSMARIAAEHEREYQAAWQAGSRWHDLGEEVAAEREAALREMTEFRAAKAVLSTGAFDVLCGLVRKSIAQRREAIAEAREMRRKLAGGDYVSDWLPGFWSGNRRLCEAFNEGAGNPVL